MSQATLTVCGDSCAEGRGGIVRPDGSFAGFVDQLARVLGISGGVVNLGAFGATTQDVVDHQLAIALRNPAPLMGAIVGGNDLVTDYDPDRFQHNLRHIFTSLRAPGRLVFATNWPNIPDRLPGVPQHQRDALRVRFAEANAFFAELVDELGIVCLDMAWAPITADPAMWSPDGMHPSPVGHRAMGTAMADLIDEASAARL